MYYMKKLLLYFPLNYKYFSFYFYNCNNLLIFLQPNRTYYLEDPEGFALEWCKAIEEMRVNTYGVSNTTCA